MSEMSLEWTSSTAYGFTSVTAQVVNSTIDPFTLDSGVDKVRAVTALLLTLLVILPNLLVLLSLLSGRSYRNCYDCLVMNLSFVNVVTITIVGTIVEIKYVTGVYPGGIETCWVQSASTLILASVNLLTVTALSAERCLAINKPFFYRLHFNDPKISVITVVGIWLMSLAFSSLPHLTGEDVVLKGAICQPRWNTQGNSILGRVSVAAGLIFILLSVVFNITTIRTIWKMRRKRAEAGLSTDSRLAARPVEGPVGMTTQERLAAEQLREKLRTARIRRRSSVSSLGAGRAVDSQDTGSVTRMIIVVTLLFAVCFIPLLVRWRFVMI